MCHAKGLFGPPSLIYLQRCFAPPTNANYARSSLFAKANIGFRLFAVGLLASLAHEIPIPVFAQRSLFAKANIGFHSMLPHAIKLLHHTIKYSISNKAINMHSRGPTEQYFCVLEPHRGCLHKVKKMRWYPLIKKGQQSHKYVF